ncbi:hypothetical protein BGZ49_004124 [Haplosporangium sp. Z 27]|nr:hypothetical protein BGZ49_004124 [Haplosporangium sp. Z 27]
MPNLRVLYFDIDDDSTDIAAALGLTTLIERCEHIAELKMSLRAKPNNSKFWKAVKNSPLLGRLSILRYQVLHQESKDKPLDLYQELQGFWDACSRLEKLGISNFEYLTNGGRSVEINWDKPGLAASRLLSHRTFPHLRHLEISQCKTNVNSQVLLMTRCPNLERLEWDLIHLGDYNVDGPIRDLCQYFKEGNSPNLKALDFSTIPGRDTIFADVLRSLDGRPMERLGFRYTAFGRLAIKELERFYPTLQVLDLTRCSDMSSSCILNILISCPILRDMKAHIIQAEDLDPRQSWSCHRTLRSLSTTFELESTSDTSDVTTHQSLCERVYSTLSHLRELEYLSIDQEEDVSVPLDVNLSHGLWKLSELKKLKRFEIGSLFTSISIKEIYWMLINWPKLIRIQELYNEDLEDIAIRIFKRRGIKYD